MVYLDVGELAHLKRDVAAFVAAAQED